MLQKKNIHLHNQYNNETKHRRNRRNNKNKYETYTHKSTYSLQYDENNKIIKVVYNIIPYENYDDDI